MQESIKKKYNCDRTTTTTRLEDLLQDAAVSVNRSLGFNDNIEGINDVCSKSGGERTAK